MQLQNYAIKCSHLLQLLLMFLLVCSAFSPLLLLLPTADYLKIIGIISMIIIIVI